MTTVVPRPQTDLIPGFLDVCPEFLAPWQEHLAYWAPERAGAYNDLGELARFVVESYGAGSTDIVSRVLTRAEQLLSEGDAAIRELVAIGLLETIQTVASHRSFGGDAFLPFLGPKSQRAWIELEDAWVGKESLMDVIRSERGGNDA